MLPALWILSRATRKWFQARSRHNNRIRGNTSQDYRDVGHQNDKALGCPANAWHSGIWTRHCFLRSWRAIRDTSLPSESPPKPFYAANLISNGRTSRCPWPNASQIHPQHFLRHLASTSGGALVVLATVSVLLPFGGENGGGREPLPSDKLAPHSPVNHAKTQPYRSVSVLGGRLNRAHNPKVVSSDLNLNPPTINYLWLLAECVGPWLTPI